MAYNSSELMLPSSQEALHFYFLLRGSIYSLKNYGMAAQCKQLKLQ